MVAVGVAVVVGVVVVVAWGADMTWEQALGSALRTWRLAVYGSSQRQAAHALGVSASVLCRWESGQRAPDYALLFRAGCSLDQLFSLAACRQAEGESDGR